MSLEENLKNRRNLLAQLRAEVVGPDPNGPPTVPPEWKGDTGMSWEEFRKPRSQSSGEEVLWQDPPTRRYGAGILYPAGCPADSAQVDTADMQAAPEAERVDVPIGDDSVASIDRILRHSQRHGDDGEEEDVSLANAFRPSAVGLSFLVDMTLEPDGFQVELVNVGRLGVSETVEAAAGEYRKVVVKVGDTQTPQSVWLRQALRAKGGEFPSVSFKSQQLLGEGTVVIRVEIPGVQGLQVVAVSRKWGEGNVRSRLLTVTIVNRRSNDGGSSDESCIFQSGLRIRGRSGNKWIVPYPGERASISPDHDGLSETEINRLLYREHQTFAIGHGCAADWQGEPLDGVKEIWSDVLPAYETPSITADLTIGDGIDRKVLRTSMRKLARLDPADDGFGELEDLIDAYETWIENLEGARPSAPPVPQDLKETAKGLVLRCRACLDRVKDGLALLREETEIGAHAREAFRLANHAMLIAQLRSTAQTRKPRLTPSRAIEWSAPIENPDPAVSHQSRGYWRPFQIAFLLMTLRGICDPSDKSRHTVDLIWFPTGGGKTEAYLGLTAFTIFFNRLSGRICDGSTVIMRYTLRLLTAQQFQRAALLFCAMEKLRPIERQLGEKPFRLGLWVGSGTTPNTRQDALARLKKLSSNSSEENPFVILRCPWCAARFGPREDGASSTIPSVSGYEAEGKGGDRTVAFRCPDPACDFARPEPMSRRTQPMLPIVVIDEDIIDQPPDLLIGTVDKFAMLAWKPELRRLFGIQPDGQHHNSPPALIIQDELHLISGPLGTMVGAYEMVIDRLCREHGVGDIGPKIVASTATISHAEEQIRNLYGRSDILLFPPSGLEAGDSFFAREATDEEGNPKPGRLYAGVLAPGHGSLQTTQARVYATLLQRPALLDIDDEGRDPWWTLLCFFNSLRELGGAATLFVGDARDYLRVILDRIGANYSEIRSPYAAELTSRIRSDEIPKELEHLTIPYRRAAQKKRDGSFEDRPIDVCLASSIIEVGVDVPRLSLMAIVGQPKTTSQYIQVSSRVGRDPVKPGLVTVMYGQSKPRDRSHYERFRTYHQRLYAQVEPTSVTPFSLPALERGLHGIVVAAVRQLSDHSDGATETPDPFPLSDGSVLRRLVDQMVRQRMQEVGLNTEEQKEVEVKLRRRLSEWRTWNPGAYGGFGSSPENAPLMHPAGMTMPSGWDRRSWPTLSSLRNVDAGCEAEVTSYFNQIEEGI